MKKCILIIKFILLISPFVLLAQTNPKKLKKNGLNPDSIKVQAQKFRKIQKHLKHSSVGFPVILKTDTLFRIYTKSGSLQPNDRAQNTSRRILSLYENDFYLADSLEKQISDYTIDIVYGELILLSVSDVDAIWNETTKSELADYYLSSIIHGIETAKAENSIAKLFFRIALVILVLLVFSTLIWLINKLYKTVTVKVKRKKQKWLKDLSYKDYTFLTVDKELSLIYFALKLIKWFIIVVLLYLSLPIIFSFFPFTQGWASKLFDLIWTPFTGILESVFNYLPNLFSIVVIYVVMTYIIRFVRYIFNEIQTEKLKIAKFHSDWAMPTYSIVKFLLYAFMLVLFFPYLPGSDSDIFKGVSVFLGVLFSLGSSSSISNIVAGLVITYMRPFKIGDRIKIGDVVGDVVEKTLLVTRLKNIKNEEITIPNSTVLSGNTINYTANSKTDGLIVHSTITIGYDVPWKQMYEVLIEAAQATSFILKEPKPFVLQTSLDDHYVSYQINAYTNEASKQAIIYSEMHQHIQDICNQRGIEIMSPHYQTLRDGNATTIPADYLPKDYKAPKFNVETSSAENKKK